MTVEAQVKKRTRGTVVTAFGNQLYQLGGCIPAIIGITPVGDIFASIMPGCNSRIRRSLVRRQWIPEIHNDRLTGGQPRKTLERHVTI